MSKELLLPYEQADLAIGLHRNNLFGIKEKPQEYITLKSERRLPHYLNIRPALSNLGGREVIVDSMAKLMRVTAREVRGGHPIEVYGHVAGTPEAMTSYAAMVAMKSGMSLLQPRVDTRKATGNKTPILGDYTEGDTVAEFDDVVTDGASKITTIEQLREAGLKVADYFVVVDREEGGAPQVEAETGISITPAIGVSSLISILHAESLITQTQYDNVAEYIGQYGDPEARASLGV